jgi:hypothetical protein
MPFLFDIDDQPAPDIPGRSYIPDYIFRCR